MRDPFHCERSKSAALQKGAFPEKNFNLAALNLSKENFNVELEVVNTPYYRVTTEFSNSRVIFEEADFTTEFDIEDGTITYSGTSVLGTIETSFGVPEEDEVMVPVIELAVAIGDGKGKTER